MKYEVTKEKDATPDEAFELGWISGYDTAVKEFFGMKEE